jgi:tetratricopeptide (TPR) repeat protein
MELYSSLILTLVIILGPIMISRLIMETATKKLDSEMKVKLLDAFSDQRKYALIVGLPLLIIYLLVLKFFPDYTWAIILGFGACYMLYYIWKSTRNYKKVKELGVPSDYLGKYKAAIIIVFLGFLGFGCQVAYQYGTRNDDYSQRLDAWQHANSGYLKMLRKDYKGAIEDYNAAISLDSTRSGYHTNLGTCWYYNGSVDLAQQEWLKAVMLGDTIAQRYLESQEAEMEVPGE